MRDVAPVTMTCPNCRSQMTVVAVEPVLFSNGQDAVTYKCKGCRSEIKRTFNQSGLEYVGKKREPTEARS